MLQATADDDDEAGTPNTALSFSIANSVPFAIDRASGNITVQGTLTAQVYNINVTVTDGGTPSLSSSGEYVVTVAPANDHSPVFEQSPYQPRVPENQVPTAPILTFSITDSDPGQEGVVTFLELDGSDSDLFYIRTVVTEPSEFNLYLNASLDREDKASYYLTVSARDSGEEIFRRTSSANITVFVDDENDNCPIFTSMLDPEVDLSESLESGYLVFNFEASDADLGGLTFTLSPTSDDFNLDPASGNLTISRQLLRARTSNYTFNVTVSDGSCTNTTTISIRVLEVNDNPPIFDEAVRNLTYTLGENISVPYDLVNISVSDLDTGVSGLVDLMLTQNSNHFQLDGDLLRIVQPLNFEDASVHVVTVTARDRGVPSLNSSIDITINVDDLNEFSPQFSLDTYTADTVYTAAEFTELVTVSATDSDGHDNRITYSLEDEPDFVEIVPTSGLIRIGSGNVPQNASVYEFIVVATDNGQPSTLSSRANVTLSVYSPLNEFAPSLDQALYNVSVNENSPVGTIVFSVTITDNDGTSTPSGQIREVYLEGSDSDQFNVSDPEGPSSVGTYTVNISTRYVCFYTYNYTVYTYACNIFAT